MCASDDRAHKSQTRRAAHITANVMQLQVDECHGDGHRTNRQAVGCQSGESETRESFGVSIGDLR